MPSEDYSPLVMVCASASGMIEGVIVQPLEMLKTRFQLNTGSRMTMLGTTRDIIAEGGFFQLYRGGLPEIIGLVPRSIAMLSSMQYCRNFFRRRNNGHLTTPAAYFSGGFSGLFEALMFTPFQVVKVRLMAKEHLGKYKNSFDCTAKIIRAEGISALMTGLGPTIWRNCAWNTVYYGSFYVFQKYTKDLKFRYAVEIVGGLGIGFVATSFNAPFDVVKSRFQGQLPGERRYRMTLPSLPIIYKEEGFTGLYRGFTPKAIRLGLGSTIGMQIFQALQPVIIGVSMSD